jgi:hypothetical protein
MSVVQIIKRAAKQLEVAASDNLPKIQQEFRNARVIGEMAVKFGSQRVQKFIDDVHTESDKQGD